MLPAYNGQSKEKKKTKGEGGEEERKEAGRKQSCHHMEKRVEKIGTGWREANGSSRKRG